MTDETVDPHRGCREIEGFEEVDALRTVPEEEERERIKIEDGRGFAVPYISVRDVPLWNALSKVGEQSLVEPRRLREPEDTEAQE